MIGPVQRALRARFTPPVELNTLGMGRPYMLRSMDSEGIVLELGAKLARTPLSWECLEGIPGFLRGREWVPAGGARDVEGTPGTLDVYLKQCIKRDTARWVTALLAEASVVEVTEGRPLLVRLSPRFPEAKT